MAERKYDLIIWGATGFTGKLVAEYIYQNYGVDGDLKWAIAGRNESKLKAVRSEIANDSLAYLLADSNDAASLANLAQQTKVICTTVGPYGKYGSKLVAACVEQQTHYCDLTGEAPWIRQMIDRHHASAEVNGVKIVHCCGFDSIPSDMGVYYAQQQAKSKTGAFATEIKMRVKGMSGGISGGTFASMMDIMEKSQEDKSIFQVLLDPYGLNPEGERHGPDKKDLQAVVYDKTAKSWIYPFVMASINTKVVRRSNALLDFTYGKNFRYEEASMSGDGLAGRMKGYAIGGVLGLAMLAKPSSIFGKGLSMVMPKPGEGPNKKDRENGFFNLRFYTTLSDGSTAVAKVIGDRDPGYGSTSKMLAESAICLAKDDLPNQFGMLTPSTAMGDALLKRLEQNAGLTFSFS